LILAGVNLFSEEINPNGLTIDGEKCYNCRMKTTSMAEIAGIVRRERKRQGATQVELSQVANVGIRFLRDVEDGKPSVHFDKLMRVLSVLGITVDILTNEEASA
jgi:y4mF family transcriptional regulator